MKPPALALLVLVLSLVPVDPAAAQEDTPRIGPFVVDVRGAIPMFPSDLQLADSRGLDVTQLPGHGLGGDVGLHVYLFKWKAVTFGIGGEAMMGRAQFTPVPATVGQTSTSPVVTERFETIAPQISFNFGTGRGWSYLSGGLGRSRWSLVAEGAQERLADSEPLRTYNYGGGARWFAKPHLAFSFDVRFWAIDPGRPEDRYPGSPRTALLVLSAGVSAK